MYDVLWYDDSLTFWYDSGMLYMYIMMMMDKIRFDMMHHMT